MSSADYNRNRGCVPQCPSTCGNVSLPKQLHIGESCCVGLTTLGKRVEPRAVTW